MAQLDPRELPESPEIPEQLVELALPELQALLDPIVHNLMWSSWSMHQQEQAKPTSNLISRLSNAWSTLCRRLAPTTSRWRCRRTDRL